MIPIHHISVWFLYSFYDDLGKWVYCSNKYVWYFLVNFFFSFVELFSSFLLYSNNIMLIGIMHKWYNLVYN